MLWCHVRHINLVKIHPQRITQNDKKFANDLNYYKVGFPVRENILAKLKRKKKIYIKGAAIDMRYFARSRS